MGCHQPAPEHAQHAARRQLLNDVWKQFTKLSSPVSSQTTGAGEDFVFSAASEVGEFETPQAASTTVLVVGGSGRSASFFSILGKGGGSMEQGEKHERTSSTPRNGGVPQKRVEAHQRPRPPAPPCWSLGTLGTCHIGTHIGRRRSRQVSAPSLAPREPGEEA